MGIEVTQYCSSFNGKRGRVTIKDYYLKGDSTFRFLKHERRRLTHAVRKLSLLPSQLMEKPPSMQHSSCDEFFELSELKQNSVQRA